MNFKKVFHGYDPKEVDKYIEENLSSEKQRRIDQKERIDQLVDENYDLSEQLKRYKADEQAISKSLIESQHLAQEMKFDAEKYSDLVLTRAKIFYATWRAYAQTLLSSLSQQEIDEFNKLQRKIEKVINAYEGKDVARELEQSGIDQITPANETAVKRTKLEVEPSATTMGTYANPISKIEQAAEHTIDLRELARSDLSLEDLCAELGLTNKKG